MAYFEAHNIDKSFGGLQAIQNVSFDLEKGSVIGFIGPNGAGKTTLFNLMSGLLKADRGQFFLNSKEITNLAAHDLVKKGIARTWQGVRILNTLTVVDNIFISMPKLFGAHPLQSFIPSPRSRRKMEREKAQSYLEFVGLADRAKDLAGDLSYPEQKLLAIGRVVATEAEMLLLDEPASGVDFKTLTKTFSAIIRRLAAEGKTICIIEHTMTVVKDFCKRVFFLKSGEIIADGTPEELMSNRELGQIYFGVRQASSGKNGE
jgi:ABC-type branched-subunit amino acid transport system ATPase component